MKYSKKSTSKPEFRVIVGGRNTFSPTGLFITEHIFPSSEQIEKELECEKQELKDIKENKKLTLREKIWNIISNIIWRLMK